MPILVFLGLSVLDLGPMYVTDRQTSDRQDSIIALYPRLLGVGITRGKTYPVLLGVTRPNIIVTLTSMQPDPDYHQNLTVSSAVVQVPPFDRLL